MDQQFQTRGKVHMPSAEETYHKGLSEAQALKYQFTWQGKNIGTAPYGGGEGRGQQHAKG